MRNIYVMRNVTIAFCSSLPVFSSLFAYFKFRKVGENTTHLERWSLRWKLQWVGFRGWSFMTWDPGIFLCVWSGWYGAGAYVKLLPSRALRRLHRPFKRRPKPKTRYFHALILIFLNLCKARPTGFWEPRDFPIPDKLRLSISLSAPILVMTSKAVCFVLAR